MYNSEEFQRKTTKSLNVIKAMAVLLFGMKIAVMSFCAAFMWIMLYFGFMYLTDG